MVYFTWVYSDATNYQIAEHDDSVAPGWSRLMSQASAATYGVYQAWLAVPNTPAKVAGNSYVTFPGGVPTYNSTQAQADIITAAAQVAYQQLISPTMMYADLVITTYLGQVAAAETLTFSAATAQAWIDWRTSMIAAFSAGKSTGVYNWPTSPALPF